VSLDDALRLVAEAAREHRERLEKGEALRGGAPREAIEALVAATDLRGGSTLTEAAAALAAAMAAGQVHGGHRRNFGFFHPATTEASVVADALVSAFNPQLSLGSQALFARTAEARLVREIGARFFGDLAVEGSFTSGGAEATFVALAAALFHAFPEARAKGLRALPQSPVGYASAEAHGSVRRAFRLLGLGEDAVRIVPTDAAGRMKVDALWTMLRADRAAGHAPFVLVATAGTTASGAIDPLPALARAAQSEGLWLHVDAAWGGLLAFTGAPSLALAGIEAADSLVFDPHKALAQPFGTGMVLVRRAGALASAFEVAAGYMPFGSSGEPYATGLAWSRRFAGARLWLTLAVDGWPALERDVRHRLAMGERLREGLRGAGFALVSETPLPIVAFDLVGARRSSAALPRIAEQLASDERAMISAVRVAGRRLLRACIASSLTQESDVDALVGSLPRE
jgi:aromatic-L-amino-acid decarboxylase